MKELEGKIVRIIDEYTLIINLGIKDGIEEDDVVRVVERGDQIIDPESEEKLGYLDFEKESLSVVTAYFSFSKVQKLSHQSTSGYASVYATALRQITKSVGAFGIGGEEITRPEKLRIESDQIQELSHDKLEDRNISVGDLVKVIVGD